MEVSVPFEKKTMEVSVTSIEIVKPSSLPTHLTKPFKIFLLDQITPSTYVPITFFYTLKNKRDNGNTFSTRLKASLSDTLTRFYPFSGRIKDNLYVHDFHEGVPYLEARANCHLFDLLSNPTLSFLNHLFSCIPLQDETSNPNMPQLTFQLTTFQCGGVALCVTLSHKFIDDAKVVKGRFGGYELEELRQERKTVTPSEIQFFVNSLRSTFKVLEAFHIPTIVVTEGAALGGELEIALS